MVARPRIENGALRCAVFFVGLVIAALPAGCADPSSPPSLRADEERLAQDVGFDPGVVARIRAHGVSLVRLQSFRRPDFAPIPGPGLVLATRPDQGESALRSLRVELEHTPYQAWLQDRAFGHGPDHVAILKSRNPYDYLAVVPVNGTNYDIDHDAIVAKYREWESRLGLVLTGAGGDWLSADITRPPEDWSAFAAEVYRFCPDVVEQGTNDVATLASEMRERKMVFLWWD
jgi:hypothetical protein